MKQRKQRLLTALLALVLLCAGSSAVLAREPDLDDVAGFAQELADYNPVPETAAVMSPQEAAQLESGEAAQTLNAHFAQDGQGNYTYPSDYAGCWLEGEVLVIALTTDDAEVIAHYTDMTGNYDKLRFERMDRSLNILYAYQDVGMDVALDAGLRIYGAASDVRTNQVVLDVEAEDIPAVWDALHREINTATFWGRGIPLLRIDDLFRVEPGEPNVLD